MCTTSSLLLSFPRPPNSNNLHHTTPRHHHLLSLRPTMHILPNFKSTPRLLHHPRLVHIIMALPPTAAWTFANGRLFRPRPFENRAFFEEEGTVVETHPRRTLDGDGHPCVTAEGGVVEDWGTHGG